MDLADLQAAQDAVTRALATVSPDGWARPSPCADWRVTDVARHLLAGERLFTAALTGQQPDHAALKAEVDDLRHDQLAAAYAEGAAALRTALAEADPTATYPTGLGPLPPAAVERLRTIEALVHGWDVARGAGVRYPVSDTLARRAHEHSLVLLERLPADRTPFAPSRPAPPDAPAIDRLAALLGRQVS